MPRFPNAHYVAHRAEWEDATHPHERNRASYLQENFVPLKDAGVLTLVDDDAEIMPGVRYRRSGGHTAHHQVVMIESGGRTAVFAADMYPTSVHIPDPWIMGYDLYPMDTLAFKRGFVREAIEREYLLFFEHDPSMAAGYLAREGRQAFRRARDLDRGSQDDQCRLASSAAAACTTWPSSPTAKSRSLTTPFGDPSGPYVLGDAARQARGVPGAARRRAIG